MTDTLQTRDFTSCGSGSCGCASGSGHDIDQKKRDFLKKTAMGGTAAGLVISPTLTLFTYGEAQAKPDDEPVTSKKRWGLLIDAAKCEDGCTKCISACSKENGWKDTGRPATDPVWIRKITVKDPAMGTKVGLPMMCQHCAFPPCVDVCPTGASFRRDDGIVLVDRHICIGCRYCMMACPYSARTFEHEPVEDQKVHAPRGKGTVEACTLCVHRVDKDQKPACVEACSAEAGGAMLFGDLNDHTSEIAQQIKKYATRQVRADLGLDVGVRYKNV